MNFALALIIIISLVSVIVCHIKVELIKHEVAYTSKVFDKASQCKKVEDFVDCAPHNQTTNVECEKFLLKINEINKTLSDEAKNAIGVYNHIGAKKIWPDKTGGPVFLLIKNQQINLMWNSRYYGWMASVYRQDIQSWESLRLDSTSLYCETRNYLCEDIVKDICVSSIEECRNWMVEVNNGNGTSMEEANVNIECEKVVTRRKVKPNKTY